MNANNSWNRLEPSNQRNELMKSQLTPSMAWRIPWTPGLNKYDVLVTVWIALSNNDPGHEPNDNRLLTITNVRTKEGQKRRVQVEQHLRVAGRVLQHIGPDVEAVLEAAGLAVRRGLAQNLDGKLLQALASRSQALWESHGRD